MYTQIVRIYIETFAHFGPYMIPNLALFLGEEYKE